MAVEEQTESTGDFYIGWSARPAGGQKLTIPNRKVTKLAFLIKKIGSPVGNLYFRIRTLADTIISEKNWGLVNDLPTSEEWIEVEFDTPVTINEEVRILFEANTQDNSNCVLYRYHTSDVKAGEHLTYGKPSGWADATFVDGTYRYTYPEVLAVAIQPMTDILLPNAKAHGTVTSLGETPCTQHGHCWSTSPNPTIADDKTELGAVASVPHTFESTLTDLVKDTTYYVRAYATDGDGTAYSAEISFTTTWRDEKALPFAPTGQIFFSPIIGSEVYVIDQGYHFYKYNLATRSWTELTSPNYGSTSDSRTRFFRTLAISPDGTKLACCSEGVFCTAGPAGYNTGGGRRVEIYDIANNTWTASKQTDFLIYDLIAYTRSLVWEDEDILWVWCIRSYRTASGWAIKCVKYTISTDTWTSYASSFQDTATGANGNNCGNGGSAIKADKSVVYGGGNAVSTYTCKKYTIATDTYSEITLDPLSNGFCHTYDRDKIWYYEAGGTGQQGYIDVADDSKHDDIYPENPDVDTSGRHGGIADDLSTIIVHAKSAAPELMSFTLIVTPTVTTNPATSVEAATATLKGTLEDDGGEACDVRFQYGETSGYGIDTDWQSGKESVVAFEQAITGLDPNKTYHFRAQARNSAGTVNGADRTFTTLAATPTVTTNPATEVGQTTATLNGELADDGGEACNVRFEYGETTDYGSYTSWQIGKETYDTFSQEVRGLKGGTVYHFRAIATNSAGTNYGADRTLHTEALSAEAHQALGKAYALGRHEL